MGGRAFAASDPPLPTPRLPPDLYFLLRDQYMKLLSTLYASVDSPIDAPGKISYGDVDIIVSSPKFDRIRPLIKDYKELTSSSKTSTDGLSVLSEISSLVKNPELLATILLLKPVRVLPTGPIKSFALPYPSMPGQYI